MSTPPAPEPEPQPEPAQEREPHVEIAPDMLAPELLPPAPATATATNDPDPSIVAVVPVVPLVPPPPAPAAPPVSVGARVREWASSVDALATRVLHAAPTALGWPVAYGASLGAGAYVWKHLAWIAALDTNKVPKADTYKLTAAVGVGVVTVAIVYGLAFLVARLRARRRGDPSPAYASIAGDLHRRLRFLLVTPLLPALTLANIERESPKETFFLITLIAVVVGATAYAWTRPKRSRFDVGADGDEASVPKRRRAAPVLAFVGVTLLWAAYTAYFGRFSIVNHHALRTSTIDLGLYDNIFFQSAHGHPLGCSFIKGGTHGSAHFDPILLLIAPFYRLYPRAEFLLGLQSLWLGVGVIPVYLLAYHWLRSRPAAFALAFSYAIYPAVHGANMYDFHSLSLITPMAIFLLYFLETERRKAYWVMLLPMLLVREDISILLCFVGAYAILSRRPGWARTGWITIAVAFTYFAVAKRVFMTSPDVLNSGDNSYSFAYYYEDLIPNHNGAIGLFISLLTNPVFVLKSALGEPKILYLATLFVPLAFLPFLARPARVLLGWGLFFTLLASRSAVYSTHFQYSSLLTPMAFATTPMALKQLEDGAFARARGLDGSRLWRAVLAGAFAASLLVSWKFGGILENATFAGGFAPAVRVLSPKDKETYEWLRTEVAKIPVEDSVGATNHVGAHVSNRMHAYHYGEKIGQVDWAFIDEGELHGNDLDKHTKLVQSGGLELVSRHDHLALFKRKAK